MLLEPEDFLKSLQLLFVQNRNTGTVSVTMKNYDGIDKPQPNKKARMEVDDGGCKKILIRAKSSKNLTMKKHHITSKLSTVVEKRHLSTFQLAYCQILRQSMDGLKKKPKRKKAGAAKKPTVAKNTASSSK